MNKKENECSQHMCSTVMKNNHTNVILLCCVCLLKSLYDCVCVCFSARRTKGFRVQSLPQGGVTVLLLHYPEVKKQAGVFSLNTAAVCECRGV